MALLLRQFELGDLPAIRVLHDRTPPDQQAYVGQVQPWPPDLDDITSNFHAFWIVADDSRPPGQDVIAMTGLAPVRDDLPGEVRAGRDDLVLLKRMRVARERQRQGWGRRLVNTAIEFANGRGWSAMILETTPQQTGAVGLYHATGFREIAKSSITSGGRLFELVWFERKLY